MLEITSSRWVLGSSVSFLNFVRKLDQSKLGTHPISNIINLNLNITFQLRGELDLLKNAWTSNQIYTAQRLWLNHIITTIISVMEEGSTSHGYCSLLILFEKVLRSLLAWRRERWMEIMYILYNGYAFVTDNCFFSRQISWNHLGIFPKSGVVAFATDICVWAAKKLIKPLSGISKTDWCSELEKGL